MHHRQGNILLQSVLKVSYMYNQCMALPSQEENNGRSKVVSQPYQKAFWYYTVCVHAHSYYSAVASGSCATLLL